MRTLKMAVTDKKITEPRNSQISEACLKELYSKVAEETTFLLALKESETEEVALIADIVYDLLRQGYDWSCSRVHMSTELLYRAMLKNGFIEEGNS